MDKSVEAPVGLQSYRSAMLEAAGVLELRAKLVAVSSVPVGAAYSTAAQLIRDAVELVDNAHDQQQVLEGRANG